jgi:hypothetical protein
MARIPMIIQALTRSGTPLMPVLSTAITNGEAAEPEPPSSLFSDDGTITEAKVTRTI